jgi:hypothetical protein
MGTVYLLWAQVKKAPKSKYPMRRPDVHKRCVAGNKTSQLAQCFDQIVEFALLNDHESCPSFDLDHVCHNPATVGGLVQNFNCNRAAVWGI